MHEAQEEKREVNLSAHFMDESGSTVSFLLEDKDSGKFIYRSYAKGDLPNLRQVIAASQKYFLYLEHGTNAAEEYDRRKKEMQQSMSKVIEQLEGNN